MDGMKMDPNLINPTLPPILNPFNDVTIRRFKKHRCNHTGTSGYKVLTIIDLFLLDYYEDSLYINSKFKMTVTVVGISGKHSS